MGRLLDLLERYAIGERDVNDEMLWGLDEEKGFSVKSMYEELSCPSQLSFPGECVWNPLIQLKVSFLMWELCWNRAPTIDNLIRRDMYIPNWCCLCKADAESTSHLFLHCPWVRYFWDHFISRFGVCWVQPDSLKNLLCWWPKQDLGLHKKGGKKMWGLILAALCWAIWEERNRRIFEGVSKESHFVLDATLSRIYNWLFVTQNTEGPPYKFWIFDWDSLILLD